MSTRITPVLAAAGVGGDHCRRMVLASAVGMGRVGSRGGGSRISTLRATKDFVGSGSPYTATAETAAFQGSLLWWPRRFQRDRAGNGVVVVP
jgi:hypothetical protein